MGRSDLTAAIAGSHRLAGEEDAPSRERSRTSGRPHSPAEREIVLIEDAKRDPAAFAPLYDAYVDLVWRYAMKRLANEERAADATSQVFIKAIAALPKYRPEMRGEGTTFRSWLMLIARNVVIDEVRKHRPALDLDAPSAQPWMVDLGRSPEDAAIASEERETVRQAVAKLPVKQQRIVQMRAMGLKAAEIAETLGMTIAGVRTANHRAYNRLRELLGEDKGTER